MGGLAGSLVQGIPFALQPTLDKCGVHTKNHKNKLKVGIKRLAESLKHVKSTNLESKHKNHKKSCHIGFSTQRVKLTFYTKPNF
jgi:hypothetical protein